MRLQKVRSRAPVLGVSKTFLLLEQSLTRALNTIELVEHPKHGAPACALPNLVRIGRGGGVGCVIG